VPPTRTLTTAAPPGRKCACRLASWRNAFGQSGNINSPIETTISKLRSVRDSSDRSVMHRSAGQSQQRLLARDRWQPSSHPAQQSSSRLWLRQRPSSRRHSRNPGFARAGTAGRLPRMDSDRSCRHVPGAETACRGTGRLMRCTWQALAAARANALRPTGWSTRPGLPATHRLHLNRISDGCDSDERTLKCSIGCDVMASSEAEEPHSLPCHR
jgi:hypothetical protein